jgi:hypothetical protein
VFSVRRGSLGRKVDARGRVGNMPMTIQRSVMSVKPACFENSVTKGAPKIAMGFLATDKLVNECLKLAGQATSLPTSL